MPAEPAPIDASACLAAFEAALAEGGVPDCAGRSDAELDLAFRALERARGAEAAVLARRLADHAPAKAARKAAKRSLYRLARAGVTAPSPETRPVVRREAERAVRAWISGIDGTGSRATWIVFEGGLAGGLHLCSLILNDQAGILDVAGGAITKRRLEAELRSIRQDQKLPWVETDPGRACGLVQDAVLVHERLGTAPPAGFARWRPFFQATAAGGQPEPGPPAEADPRLLERGPELLGLVELQDWFVDPEELHEEAVALLEARDSRLVVPDAVKAEREAAIVERAAERAFTPPWRERWARRLLEMAWIFRATGRPEEARLAEAQALALGSAERPVWAIPLARALAERGLEVASEVALGRARLSEVSRRPRAPARS
jgi:hypothetical protein